MNEAKILLWNAMALLEEEMSNNSANDSDYMMAIYSIEDAISRIDQIKSLAA